MASQLAMKKGVLSRVLDLLVLAQELGDLHLSTSDGAGLANEDLVHFAHPLRGIKLLDKDAILTVHSSGGVGQGHADCEWQALGDHDDEQNHEDVRVPETLLEEHLVPWLVSRDLDDKHDDDKSKDDDACKEGELDELLLQVLELGLQSGVFVGVELSLDDSSGGVLADAANDSFALSSLDDGSGEQAWFLAALVAVLVLLDDVAFVIQSGWLVDLEVLGIDDEAVGGDTGAGLEKDHVADDDVPDADALRGTEFASDDWHVLFLDVSGKFNVFFVFQVVGGGNDGDEEDGDQNDGNALPDRLPLNEEKGDCTREECSGTDCDPQNVRKGLHY